LAQFKCRQSDYYFVGASRVVTGSPAPAVREIVPTRPLKPTVSPLSYSIHFLPVCNKGNIFVCAVMFQLDRGQRDHLYLQAKDRLIKRPVFCLKWWGLCAPPSYRQKKSAARWPHYRESSKLVLVIHPSAVHTNAVAEVPGPRTGIPKTAVTYLRTPVLSVVFIAVVVFLLSMIGPVPQTDLSPAISPIRSVSSVLFALCRYRITACRQ